MFSKSPIRGLQLARHHYRSFTQVFSLFDISEQVYNDNRESRFAQPLPNPKQIYYFERGCRVVYPYFTILQAYCLGSWQGKCVSEVYFKDRKKPPRNLRNEIIENGFMRVNKKKVSPDYVMQMDDVLSHVFHFHENPIIDLPYKVAHVDHDFIVVNKPPGIPMHSGGKYKHNCLVAMIRQKWGMIHGINRIDAVTSGIVVFVRSQAKAKELSGQMANRQIVKEYICEVPGNFPHDEIEVDAPLARCYNETGPVIVDHHSGDPSRTLFKKVKYKHNSGTSILSCFPLTGRTHQIRVHLQYLGFPIVNDFVYGSPSFGPNGGKNGDYGGLSDREIFSLNLMESQKRIAELKEDSVDVKDEYDNLLQDYRTDEWIDYTHEHCYDTELDSRCKECYVCKMDDREPPARSKKFLRLYALRYKGPDWDFAVDLPYWAR